MPTLTPNKNPITQPVYQRIERDLRDRIDTGAWASGAALPSRAALAREYGVGLATLERAVAAMLADGTLHAVPGHHTVVAPRSASVRTAIPTRSSDSDTEVLGIISYDSLFENEPKGSIDGWLCETARCLERSYLDEGGVTLFKAVKTHSDRPPKTVEELVNELRAEGANKIVLIDLNAALKPSETAVLARLHGRDGVLIVHVSSSESEMTVPHVYYDGPYLGRQAAKHLAQRGFTQFTYVSPFNLPWSHDRCDQARSMAIDLGLGESSFSAIFGDATIDQAAEDHNERQIAVARDLGRELFSSPDFPRCVIAANDFAAFGLIQASHERGLAQGVDYAIVGFDDEVQALRYGLTTFRPPIEEIGHEAALLLTRLSRGERCSMQVRLRSRLVARASTLSADVMRGPA